MNARILEVSADVPLSNQLGKFAMRGYLIAEGRHVDTHIAVIHGTPTGVVPVRINSACMTSEVFEDGRCDCAWQMWEALRRFVERGQGVMTYHPTHEGRGVGLFQKLQSYALMDKLGLTTADAFATLGETSDARDYEAAVAILSDLHIEQVELISNNPAKEQALLAGNIEIVARDRIVGAHNPRWHEYLSSKALSFGHAIELTNGAEIAA